MSNGIEKFETKVSLDRQKPHPVELLCGGVFYVVILAQVILSVYALAQQNSGIPTVEVTETEMKIECPGSMFPAFECCGGSFQYDSMKCVTQDLCDEMRTCTSACQGSGRRLQGLPGLEELRAVANETHPAGQKRQQLRSDISRRLNGLPVYPENVWAFFEEHFYLPTVLFLGLFALALVWLLLLLKAPVTVVWGTIFADLGLLVAVFLYFKADTGEVNVFPLVVAIVGAIAAFVLRKQVTNAGVCLGTAMKALEANRRLFPLALGVQLLWGAFFGLWVASLIALPYKDEVVVDEGGLCKLSPAHPLDAFYTFWVVSYYWASFFFQNMNLCMMSVQLGAWYFAQEGSIHMWMKGLRWSVTSLAGGNAICSAILGVTSYLQQYVNSKARACISVLNPIEWIPLCMAFALKTCIFTYTKFGMISQAFYGKPYCQSAKTSMALLKDRLGEAVVTNFIGERVMQWATYVLCVGLAFCAWAWAEDLHEIYIIREVGVGGAVGLMMMLMYFNAKPFLSIILIIVFESVLGDLIDKGSVARAYLNIVFAALFVGAVAFFIMTFISSVVVDAMNVIFFCFSVEAQNGQSQERFNELYGVVKAVAAGTDPNQAGAVAQSKAADGADQGTAAPVAEPATQVVGQPLDANNTSSNV